MQYTFEGHIVFYSKEIQFDPLPGFFDNPVVDSPDFCSIHSFETNSAEDAWKLFHDGCQKSDQLLKSGQDIKCHVKLERVVDHAKIIPDKKSPTELSLISKDTFNTKNSSLIAAFDLHFDGIIQDPKIEGLLVYQAGFIPLKYTNQKGEVLTTLTLHTLTDEKVWELFHHYSTILSGHGMSGTLYTETPLAFIVYGETGPRTIIL